MLSTINEALTGLVLLGSVGGIVTLIGWLWNEIDWNGE